MNEVLKVENLKKTFIEYKLKNWKLQRVLTDAVKEISFTLKKGEILGLLGRNGAGKTTTIQMLLGSLTPTSGEIKYFGEYFDGENPQILKKINYSSAYADLPWRMTIFENLDVYARLYGVTDRKKKIQKLLQRFEMSEFADKKMRSLSAGQKTRVFLAKAFLNYPEIILLDEPTASLDPEIANEVRLFLLEQQKNFNVSMLFTSHNMKEVQEVCDRIIFIDKGKIIAHDTPVGLLKKFKDTKIRFKIESGKENLVKYLDEKGFSFKNSKGKFMFGIEEHAIPKVLYKLSNLGVRYQELEVIRPDLEDFFLNIATESKNK